MDDEFSLNELLIADGLLVILFAIILITKGCANG